MRTSRALRWWLLAPVSLAPPTLLSLPCCAVRRCALPLFGRYAEMGSSASILRAGYNIDSLMLRYQGVDWRQTENWGCNAA